MRRARGPKRAPRNAVLRIHQPFCELLYRNTLIVSALYGGWNVMPAVPRKDGGNAQFRAAFVTPLHPRVALSEKR